MMRLDATTSIGRLHRDDRGIAIAVVMLVGVALVLVSSIMIARGFRQLVNTANDSNWDTALFAAEAALDQGLVVLDYDFEFTTGESLPDGILGTNAERSWAVDAADALSDTDLYRVPDAEFALVRPANADVLFAVGFAPSRASTERRVRVLRATIEGQPWTYTLEYALVAGDDLELSGSGNVNDINENDGASVHANGTVVGEGSYSVEGCLTSTESTRNATSVCPPSPLPPEPLPVIDPVLLYPYAQYTLCVDGLVYGGPAHPTDPDVDLVPCNANETLVSAVGWEATLLGGVPTWTTTPSADANGVFYIHLGNFDGKLGSKTSPAETTIVLEALGGGSCTAPATGQMRLDGNSYFTRHPSLGAAGMDLAIVAQGDVAFEGRAAVGGAILAHEQVDYRGTADSWGSVAAVDACDTLGSPVSDTVVTGTAVINYPGPIVTPFTASSLHATVVGWYEL